MFTGIVAERGKVTKARTDGDVLRLQVQAPRSVAELEPGDSVAVNGVCLTVTRTTRKRFTVDAVPQTLRSTTLGGLARGVEVNLELPVRLADRLGGHLVQGHVDAVAEVLRVDEEGGSRRLSLTAPSDLFRFMVAKGSITLDGVSLTLAHLGDSTFEVALIPQTLERTTLGSVRAGSKVNVEVDLVGKHLERLVSTRREGG